MSRKQRSSMEPGREAEEPAERMRISTASPARRVTCCSMSVRCWLFSESKRTPLRGLEAASLLVLLGAAEESGARRGQEGVGVAVVALVLRRLGAGCA